MHALIYVECCVSCAFISKDTQRRRDYHNTIERPLDLLESSHCQPHTYDEMADEHTGCSPGLEARTVRDAGGENINK